MSAIDRQGPHGAGHTCRKLPEVENGPRGLGRQVFSAVVLYFDIVTKIGTNQDSYVRVDGCTDEVGGGRREVPTSWLMPRYSEGHDLN